MNEGGWGDLGMVHENLINRENEEDLRGYLFFFKVCGEVELVKKWNNSRKKYFHDTNFSEILWIIVLKVTGIEGQETENFLGVRKSTKILVGREY